MLNNYIDKDELLRFLRASADEIRKTHHDHCESELLAYNFIIQRIEKFATTKSRNEDNTGNN